MSIRIKLFLAFLMTTFVVVMGMHFFTHWSLERGFTEFIEKKQQERLDKIIDVLNEDKSILFGQEKLISRLTLYPIQHESRTVGFLELLSGDSVSQPSDIYFMEQQD